VGGESFRTCPDLSPGPNQPTTWWVLGLSRRQRRPGCDDHPPPSSAEVEGRVKLYIYSPSGPLWPVLRWTFMWRTQNPQLTLPRTILFPLTNLMWFWPCIVVNMWKWNAN